MSETKRSRPTVIMLTLTSLIEWYALAEVLWYYSHDGEETLRDALARWIESARERFNNRAAIRQTAEMIRNLPETER